METGKELFESIMNSCPRKKVVSLCKKLIKKCSFNSGEDVTCPEKTLQILT